MITYGETRFLFTGDAERDADVTVYRTALNGDVVAVSDEKTVTIITEKAASNEDIMTLGGTVQEPVVTTPTEDDNSEPDAGIDYVLNTNSKKFHYPSCSSVDDMKESNKQYYTGSRDDLIASGYSPCGRCHP